MAAVRSHPVTSNSTSCHHTHIMAGLVVGWLSGCIHITDKYIIYLYKLQGQAQASPQLPCASSASPRGPPLLCSLSLPEWRWKCLLLCCCALSVWAPLQSAGCCAAASLLLPQSLLVSCVVRRAPLLLSAHSESDSAGRGRRGAERAQLS